MYVTITITLQTITIQQGKIYYINIIFSQKLVFFDKLSIWVKNTICLVLCTFKHDNLNSEHTFISSTLKVEETKVSSELKIL